MEVDAGDAVQRAQAGDMDAFRVLVEQNSRAIFRLAYRMTGNEQDAEDVVQETFVRAYKQLHRFDGRAAFSSWLYRIADNCSLDSLRARKSRNELGDPGDSGFSWLDQLAASDPSPERLSQRGQLAQMLEPALAELSDIERTAFVLRHFEGCDIDEIARTLGVRAN